jgi:hypothetical protein
VKEIKAHPFLAGVDWEHIRDSPAPIDPEVEGELDTHNFDKFPEGAEVGGSLTHIAPRSVTCSIAQ